ncbi:hypothetical protein CROQUDRAFT_659108 [Cronartium quercuum f. sp. fusiforme G11]|uniref:FAD synthase n=1 Tax=Cronartium quercuum f. sp. fusiforme G11 TaxID=708437 RepID=A0A9P6NFE7_9BASI|nr:hypothetical protein CROQUDRAFT_659108 [Cronartium quercuum f. sp. fusiforme G11]
MNPDTRPFDRDDAQAVYDLAASTAKPELAKKVAQALDVIQKSILEYGADEVALSFNGGKDCTVIIHLLAAALARSSNPNSKMRALYIRCRSPFGEVEDFMKACQARYNVELFSFEGNLKDGLQAFLSQASRRAILIGTRSTDPNGARLTALDPTDNDWPSVMRIHPILSWSYHDIWDFLRILRVGWCELYNMGYTSLGSTFNTRPNPHLASPMGWRPAWELTDGALERAGRSPCTVPTAQ